MWGSSNSHRSQSPVEITVRNLDTESRDGLTASSPLSMGSLLRLFRSEFFDAFMAVTYLYRYRDSRGVHDYLCNQLYALGESDLERFMPQLCNILVYHARQSPALERFVMDKCADSMHIALQVFWYMQAAVEDASRRPDSKFAQRVRLLRSRCETAAVNGSSHVMIAAAAERISAATLVDTDPPFSPRARQISGKALFHSSSAGDLAGKNIESGDVRDERTVATRSSALKEEPNQISTISTECDGSTISHSLPVKRGSAEASNCVDEQACDERIAPHAQEIMENATVSCGSSAEGSNKHERTDTDDGKKYGGGIVDAAGSEHEKKTSTVTLNVTNCNEGVANNIERASKESNVVESQSSTSLSGSHDQNDDANILETSVSEEVSDSSNRSSKSRALNVEEDFDPLAFLAMKQERCDYFNDSVSVAKAFVRLSLTTRDLPPDKRMAHLTRGLQEINDMLLRRMKGEPGEPLLGGSSAPLVSEIAKLGRAAALRSVHLPLTRACSQALRVIRVHTDEVIILTSRTRAPYMVNIEVLPTDMLCSDKLLFCEHHVLRPESGGKRSRERRKSKAEREWTAEHSKSSSSNSKSQSRVNSKNRAGRRLSEMTPAERQRANVRKVVYGDAFTSQPEVFAQSELQAEKNKEDQDGLDYKSRQAVILGVYGELWSWKEDRILSRSPFNTLKGTKLMPFIVKAGDDLRQEQLAIQLIRQFENVFAEEGVDVYLKAFTVMSVSSEAGFVEVVKDAVSVHSLKKRVPNFVSLLDYFERAYGRIGTDRFRAAQRRFIRSMAGYSLVTYFLQIKDRHNGNIMIDALGRIIHIDFGFMLTNSPGAIKFESVPFKLTEEYLQVICARTNVQDLGEASKTEGYRYFQELFVLGLLAARKHYEKITMLVEIMSEGTTMPCMMSGQASGQAIVEVLRSRFAVGMPEEQCINFAMGLIEESRLSWRSAGYDRFQAYSNGYR